MSTLRGARRALLQAIVAPVLLAGCISMSSQFRSQPPATDYCDAGSALVASQNTEIRDGAPIGPWVNCFLQTHALVRPASENQGSATLTYTLSYVEFNGNGDPIDRRQLLALRSHLEQQERNLVVYFIHGWRVNAGPNRTDVQKFRTILAYLSSFIEQRCGQGDASRRYCGASLTGVFVGWPGRVVHEAGLVTAPLWGPTFPIAKSRGSRIALRVFAHLDGIEAALTPERDRSMLIAHSAGANLVLRAFLDTMGGESPENRRGHSRLDEMTPSESTNWQVESSFSDLAVLINPASEAANWIELQGTAAGWLDGRAEDFPLEQPPEIISITSACDREDNPHPDHPRDRVRCDGATFVAFPLSQALVNFRFLDADRVALGHYLDRGKFGVSHAVVDNSNASSHAEFPTRYGNVARDASWSQCEHGYPWLYRARTNLNRGATWDLYTDNRAGVVRTLPPSAGNKVGRVIRVQWRHGTRQGMRRPLPDRIPPSHTPFWNARSDHHVTADHGGFVSYPLLCSLTQLWLDDVHLAPESAQ